MFSLKNNDNYEIEVIRKTSKIVKKEKENYDQDIFYIQDI